ncbi:MAG: histidine kinase N-terminal 7TM domain-containing protein [Actinomycetota bacterium]|nr:histidine kinase N-terminal 7TM domain-containing protein [Actinomycetota bacterium]
MTGELPRAISAASGLISLGIGLYVLARGYRRLVNVLFFLLTVFLAIWALGDAMVAASSQLGDRIFWTKIQGVGELPMVPTYLLIALYFPTVKGFMRDRRRAAAVTTALYAPFLLGLVFLFTTDFVYKDYMLSSNGQGLAVVRTPFFWFLTVLGFAVILATTAIYLWERRRDPSKGERMGLLLLALAPMPMLVANVLQNFEIYPQITTPMSSVLFVGMIAYGIMRYGLFIDFRSVTKGLLVHTTVIAVNLSLFSLLCAFYYYGLQIRQGPLLYAMFVLTGMPFIFGYHAEMTWMRRQVDRYIYGRELEECRLLQELDNSIKTVHGLREIAESVVDKVRESMSLTVCALLLKSDGRYRIIGYSSRPDHISNSFEGVVEEGMHAWVFDNGYNFDCDSGHFSCHWEVGDRLTRGGCVLDYLNFGILYIYNGEGDTRELLWRRKVEGEAISVPLRVRGEDIGYLWMGGKAKGQRFSVEELDFIVALSTQVAVSLQNSLLLQELLDKSLRLQTLVRNTTTAQEEERIRISRELHDGMAPYFVDILFKVEALQEEMDAHPGRHLSLDEVSEKARQGLRDLRQVIADLRPSSLDVLGLEKSLSTYLERFGVENGMEVEFKSWGSLRHLDSLWEVTVFRVAQEALSNIVRHAEAGRVRMSLGSDNGYLEMVVEDDGIGFNQKEIGRKIATGEKLGIKGMRERAELLQGSLNIQTRQGQGTRIRFTIPLESHKEVLE